MKKDNNKLGVTLIGLFALLIAGCEVSNLPSTSYSSNNSVDSSIKTSVDSQISSTSKSSTSSTSSSTSNTSSSTTSSSDDKTSQNSSTTSNIDSSSNSSNTSISNAEVYITNKNELAKEWKLNSGDRMINLSANNGINANLEVEKGNITITSSDTNVVEVYGLYLHPIAEGTVTITVQYQNAKDSVELTIISAESSAPRLFLDYDGFTKYSALQGNAMTIPNYICIDKNNNDITSTVSVTSDLDPNAVYDASNNTFTSSVVGEHTLTYTAVDLNDSSLKTEKTIKVNVFRKIFLNAPVSNVYQEYNSENQYIEMKDGGMSVSRFNMPAGKVYYAEAVYNTTYDVIAGLMHVDEEGYTTSPRWLYMGINPTNKRMNIKDNHSWTQGNSIEQENITNTMNIKVDDGKVKVGSARIGNMFYLFINDQYVESYASERYTELDTRPGLYMNAYSSESLVKSNFVKVTNIDFYNDEAAVLEKVTTLTKGKMLKQYLPTVGQWGYSMNSDKLEFGYSEERGNYVDVDGSNGQNASIWSPYINATTSFSFEFDYTFESTNATVGTQDGRMWVEIRKFNNGNSHVEFGAKYSMDDPQFMMDREAYLNNSGTDYNGATSKYYQPTMSSLGVSKTDTFHYKITRQLYSDHSDFIMEISKADGTVIATKTYSHNSNFATEELTVLVQNKNVSGKFSNIQWSIGGEN